VGLYLQKQCNSYIVHSRVKNTLLRIVSSLLVFDFRPLVESPTQHKQLGFSNAGWPTLLCPDCMGGRVKRQRLVTSGENRHEERKDEKQYISEYEDKS